MHDEPKSTILMKHRLGWRSRMFSGLRSQWMTAHACLLQHHPRDCAAAANPKCITLLRFMRAVHATAMPPTTNYVARRFRSVEAQSRRRTGVRTLCAIDLGLRECVETHENLHGEFAHQIERKALRLANHRGPMVPKERLSAAHAPMIATGGQRAVRLVWHEMAADAG